MAVLQLHNANKSFGKTKILQDVHFTLNEGEILGLFGRNGCGKSTLLKMMFGTLKANTIKMSIDGVLVEPSEARKKQLIAYLPQHPFVPKHVKVRDVIPMFHDSEEKQDAVFYNPPIAKFIHKRAGELSFGELKYFEVVLIGNTNHPFLMLDEPFSMLEPLHKEALKEFLNSIKQKKGIIITDHYYNDVLDITDQNLIIKDGRIFKVSSEKDLAQFEYLSKNNL